MQVNSLFYANDAPELVLKLARKLPHITVGTIKLIPISGFSYLDSNASNFPPKPIKAKPVIVLRIRWAVWL